MSLSIIQMTPQLNTFLDMLLNDVAMSNMLTLKYIFQCVGRVIVYVLLRLYAPNLANTNRIENPIGFS